MKIFYKSKRIPLKHLLFLAFILFVSVLQINAQNIVQLDQKLNEDSGDAKYFQNLILNSHAYITLNGADFQLHGNGSYTILNTSPKNLNLLYTTNKLFDEVELINLKINEMSDIHKSIDLEQLEGFNNLTFINVIFTFDVCGHNSQSCLKNFILDLIQGIEEVPVLITYKLSIPN